MKACKQEKLKADNSWKLKGESNKNWKSKIRRFDRGLKADNLAKINFNVWIPAPPFAGAGSSRVWRLLYLTDINCFIVIPAKAGNQLNDKNPTFYETINAKWKRRWKTGGRPSSLIGEKVVTLKGEPWTCERIGFLFACRLYP